MNQAGNENNQMQKRNPPIAFHHQRNLILDIHVQILEQPVYFLLNETRHVILIEEQSQKFVAGSEVQLVSQQMKLMVLFVLLPDESVAEDAHVLDGNFEQAPGTEHRIGLVTEFLGGAGVDAGLAFLGELQFQNTLVGQQAIFHTDDGVVAEAGPIQFGGAVNSLGGRDGSEITYTQGTVFLRQREAPLEPVVVGFPKMPHRFQLSLPEFAHRQIELPPPPSKDMEVVLPEGTVGGRLQRMEGS